MAISEFERQRQENIERNKRLLNSLNLDAISSDILNHIKQDEAKEAAKKPAKKAPSAKKQKVEKAAIPTRRSRRLAGVPLTEEDKAKEFELEEEKRRKEREEFEKLKSLRVNGDLSLIDLIKEEGDVDDQDESKALEKFKSFLNNYKNFSIGDYYETITRKDKTTKDVKQLRSEFDKKSLYRHFKPNDLKLTKERMTYISFHPSKDHKLIIGGDTGGHCGIFNPQSTDIVDITSFKLHGKSIAKLEYDMNDLSKVYTASYDGSIRSIDLKSLKSSQFFIHSNDVGISDINYNNDNEMYYTTLDGEFGHLDIRASDHSAHQILRLSNKKIGGFTINPLNKYQIATGSLDRTLKVWDIRNINSSQSWNEIDELQTAHLYGTYNSRLSVSLVDWNHSNDLVCNGYDDTVNIFNLDEDSSNWATDYEIKQIKPDHTIKHNCQTGRWVSILKARWQKYPTDSNEKLVIANMNKYFDVYNRDGTQIAHLTNPLMTNVPAVCNFHQTENWLVGGGASGKVYLFY